MAQQRGLADARWLQILTAATALLAAGIALGLGGSIFIAAFVGGFVFGGVRRGAEGEVGYLVDQGGELLNAVTFLVFGAVILGPALDDLTWELVLYALLSLTVVRMLPVARRHAGNPGAAADDRLPRLVRAARARLDRVRVILLEEARCRTRTRSSSRWSRPSGSRSIATASRRCR